MKIAGVDFSEQILLALRNKRLVIFAGAGVSMGKPACLPDFKELADKLKEDTGLEKEDCESVDRFLGRLKGNGTDIYEITAEILSRGAAPTSLHFDLLRLHGNAENVRIVTTNFDLLFEEAAKSVFQDKQLEVFRAPALPLGNDFRGIVHIHGSVRGPAQMILTTADFGRAYIVKRWASRFLVDLFQNYNVLFIGYSHNDVIMNYLSQAFAEIRPGTRFALIERGNENFWNDIGITPILYDEKNDHKNLNESVARFSEIMNWSILDWKKEIEDIAGSPPPVLEEEEDVLKEGLKADERVKFFTKAAKSPEWIDWLDKNGYLKNLFSDSQFSKMDQLSEADWLFAQWLSSNFIVEHAEKLQFFISSRGMHIHPTFFLILSGEIASTEKDISDELLSRWVSFLLKMMPVNVDAIIGLIDISKSVSARNLIQLLLKIFFTLSENNFSINKNIPEYNWGGHNDRVMIHYIFKEIWSSVKPHLSNITISDLRKIIIAIEEEHAEDPEGSRNWDNASIGRSNLELPAPDYRTSTIDILIDAARDCLAWGAKCQPIIAASWCVQLINSDAPILRRLAVLTLGKRIDLTADKKINWLLDNIDIYDGAAFVELLRVMSAAYSQASEEIKGRLVEVIYQYQAPDDYSGDKKALKYRQYFEWFASLSKSDPNCDIAKRNLEEIQRRYPDMRQRDYQDSDEEGELVPPHPPWTTSELVSMPVEECVKKLENYQSGDMDERDYNLRGVVCEAIKIDPDWGFKLAKVLAVQGKWDKDIWGWLIDAWSEMDLSDENHRNQILTFLEKEEVYPHHQLTIARFLESFIKKEGMNIHDALPRLNRIGINLWGYIQDESSAIDDFQLGVLNKPAPLLALFFVNSISIWYKSFKEKPKQITDQYRSILINMIEKSLWSVAVLAGQFSFLQYVDKKWTEDYLLPSFDRERGNKQYQAAWSGFLFWGRLFPDTAKSLSPMFLKAVVHIEEDFVDNKSKFIEFYAAMIFYFIDKPLAAWIPKLFHSSNLASKLHFARAIGSQLRRVDESKIQESWNRWLRQYWENRLSGIPAILTPEEAGCMVQWIGHLDKGGLFPKAVELAVQMPSADGFIVHFLNDISTGEQASLYPEDTAKLLIYLGTAGSDTQIGLQRYAPEIIRKLPLNQLPSNLARGIEELKVKFSLN